MKKQITLKEFEKCGYKINGNSNWKLIDGYCIKCHKNFFYHSIKTFMKNRKIYPEKKNLWNTCSKCWFKIQTTENNKWIEKNRNAQLIAQNKPEQKALNAKKVSESWTDKRKKEASKLLKIRWKDPEFKKTALKNIEWTNGKNIEKFNKNIKKSLGTGGLFGEYKNIQYDSALELSYILYCIENKIQIVRYNIDPIPYKDSDGKSRIYIPDFIINNNCIIEIKGYGLYYNKNYQTNIIKTKALKDFANQFNYDFRIIFSDSKILKQNYKKARKIHYENQE